jgi:uncharacterized protein (DUF2252 family)
MVKSGNDESLERVDERQANGKALRKQVPRRSHGEWAPASNRPDPIDLLQQQDAGRLDYLLPIKYGRMMASPFAFLRGSAVVMASDLSTVPRTDLDVALCGDAHLSNFGIFATPERNIVFDINDFDETYLGPFEWDVKRLAASAVVAGRGNGFDAKTNSELAQIVAGVYRDAMGKLAAMTVLDVWYYAVDSSDVVNLFRTYAAGSVQQAKNTFKKARRRTGERTLAKLTQTVDGKLQIINNPPLVVRLDNLMTDEEKAAAREQGNIQKAWQSYLESLPLERRRLLTRYRITDAALRVGGVGSVGTRCLIALLEGDRPEDAIILQQKESGPSALAAYLPARSFASEAERVVVGQRLMQASSDIFLGWSRTQTGRDYYWRQLKDMKGSFNVDALGPQGLGTYLAVCAACLARAHARSGDPVVISSYLGKSDVWMQAMAQFADRYADQTELDYQALVTAVKQGRIVAETGI